MRISLKLHQHRVKLLHCLSLQDEQQRPAVREVDAAALGEDEEGVSLKCARCYSLVHYGWVGLGLGQPQQQQEALDAVLGSAKFHAVHSFGSGPPPAAAAAAGAVGVGNRV